jgi:hypothetical protein
MKGQNEYIKGKEELRDYDDLIVFRWLSSQISHQQAITACLLVLQGIACNEEPLGEAQ